MNTNEKIDNYNMQLLEEHCKEFAREPKPDLYNCDTCDCWVDEDGVTEVNNGEFVCIFCEDSV